MFQMLTCLQCGHEWKSKIGAKRPQCSICGSTNNIPSKDIPPNIKFKKEIEILQEEVNKLKEEIHGFLMSHKEEHTQLTTFELQVVHDLKDLLFWKEVFDKRTNPKAPEFKNPDSALRPVQQHRPPEKPFIKHPRKLAGTAAPMGDY